MVTRRKLEDDTPVKQSQSLKLKLDHMNTIQPKTAKQQDFFDASNK